MASTDSTKPSFAFSYGFATGNLHGRLMKRLLQQAGYKSAPLETADIIVAHSAGCWLMPDMAHPKLVIYVGMPLAKDHTRKTWLKTQLRKRRYWRRRYTRLLHVYYLLVRRKHNRKILKMAVSARPRLFPKAQTIFIANEHDLWPRGKILDEYVRSKPWTFIGLAGGHNNVWREPEKYVAIINHYAELLA